MNLIRFPFGTCNAKALAAVADVGLLAIQSDVVTGDPDPHRSATAIANTILARVHPGAIVVAHANGRGRNTAAALAIALPKLKGRGYNFVTVSELIKPASLSSPQAAISTGRAAKRASPGRARGAAMPGPFSAVDLAGARLIALDPARAGELAAAIVAMKPWSEMNYPAEIMARFLISADGGVSRYLIVADGTQREWSRFAIPGSKGRISSCSRSCRISSGAESAPTSSPG